MAWRAALALLLLLVCLCRGLVTGARSAAQPGVGSDPTPVADQPPLPLPGVIINGDGRLRPSAPSAMMPLATQVRLAEYQAVWQDPPGKPAGYYAPNRRHNLMSAFTVHGAQLSPRVAGDQQPWLWALRPATIGVADYALPLPSVARWVKADGQGIEIEWDDLLSEWYLNDEAGVEHGFVIHQRPATLVERPAQQPLILQMSLFTDLTPTLVDEGELRFSDERGIAVLRYAGLHVFDADGRVLPARFTIQPAADGAMASAIQPQVSHAVEAIASYALSILIDERDARYPLTVDPLITGYERRLTASDGASSDQLGAAVALSGDTLVVGAPNADVGINLGQGAAYLFERNQGGANAWDEVKRLTASDGAAFDGFGGAVAIDGDLVIVGAPGDNVGENADQGAAYLFGRDHGGVGAWGQVKKIAADGGAPFDRFGVAVAVAGDTAVVGASGADIDGKLDQGAAYIYERNQGGVDGWGQVKRLIADDGAAGAFFGGVAAIYDETVVIGAGGAKVGDNTGQGAAYIFGRNQAGPNAWGQAARLTADDGAPFDSFGGAAAIDGDRVLVGAADAEVQGRANQGAAYLFERSHDGGGVWEQIAKLVATGGAGGDRFGDAVALDAAVVMVGARGNNIGPKNDQGSAYLFERNHGGAGAWGQMTRLTGADGAANDGFGAAVAVEGGVFVAGAPGKDVNGNFDQGAAYLFDLQIGRLADLRIQKTVMPTAAPGAIITYTLAFENQGPGGAINVVVKDSLPADIALTSVVTSAVGQGVRIIQTGAPPDLIWAAPWLDRGDGGVITLRAQIRDELALDGVTLTNTATITATNDVTPVNNAASAAITVLAPKARLTVTKVVINDNGGTKQVGDFPLFVNDAPLTSGAPISLSFGVYTVAETGAPGYVAVFQGDCDAAGKVTLAPGDAKACTVVNDDQPASLTVNKVVVNDNGGSGVVGDFPLFVNGAPVTPGAAAMLDAGTYTVTETSAAGYTASFSGDCDAAGRVTLNVGDVKTCTLTNDDPAPSVIYLPIVVR